MRMAPPIFESLQGLMLRPEKEAEAICLLASERPAEYSSAELAEIRRASLNVQ
jgi:hypothetical protein